MRSVEGQVCRAGAGEGRQWCKAIVVCRVSEITSQVKSSVRSALGAQTAAKSRSPGAPPASARPARGRWTSTASLLLRWAGLWTSTRSSFVETLAVSIASAAMDADAPACSTTRPSMPRHRLAPPHGIDTRQTACTARRRSSLRAVPAFCVGCSQQCWRRKAARTQCRPTFSHPRGRRAAGESGRCERGTRRSLRHPLGCARDAPS